MQEREGARGRVWVVPFRWAYVWVETGLENADVCPGTLGHGWEEAMVPGVTMEMEPELTENPAVLIELLNPSPSLCYN